MKRVMVLSAAFASLALAACGGGEVTLQATIEGADGEQRALSKMPVRLLPYDRDSIFTELERAYGRPQPEIPDSLRALQDQIAAAQTEWSNAEAIWSAARDSLQKLSQRMRGMSRGSGEYVVAFREFTAQEGVANRTEQQSRAAFQRFEQLQARYAEQAEGISLARAQWADEAFASIDSVIAVREQEAGRQEMADTTNDNGTARFEGVKKGRWWVYARYELPYEELYWNVPIEVGGDPTTVELTRQTAQVRPKL